MRVLKKLFEGYRGEIFLAHYKNRLAVLKRKKRESPDFIEKEYKLLKNLNGLYSPKVFEKSKDYILMEYVKGFDFKEALKIDRKRAILLALELSYFLDKQGVYHSQLGRYYHLIISKDFKTIKALDFERTKINSNQKNLLQIIGFYLRDEQKYLKDDIKIYKSDIDRGYEKIVEKVSRLVG